MEVERVEAVPELHAEIGDNEMFDANSEVVDNIDDISVTSVADDEEDDEQPQSSFKDFLREEFGWEDNIPDDVTPEETIKTIVGSYTATIEELQQQLEKLSVQQINENDILKELESDYSNFLKLSERDAVVEHHKRKYDGVLDDEDIEQLVVDLEANGKLGLTYKMIKNDVAKEFVAEKESIIKEMQQRDLLLQKEEEAEYHKAIAEFDNEVTSFKSDYFDVNEKEKQFAKMAFTQKTENGRSLFETMLDNPKTALEMFFAYLKAEDMDKVILNEKKKIESNLVNSLSSAPIFNSKINGNSKYDIAGFNAEEI